MRRRLKLVIIGIVVLVLGLIFGSVQAGAIGCVENRTQCVDTYSYQVCQDGGWSSPIRCASRTYCGSSGSCVACTCSGSNRFCGNGDNIVWGCNGCFNESVFYCPFGCSNGECDSGDACSGGESKCEGGYEYSCDTAANPNVWDKDTHCTYGCNTDNTACATAPSLPYCVTEPSGCGKFCKGPSGDKTCGSLESCVVCYRSYQEYDEKKPPVSNTCVNKGNCDGGCVPTQTWCEGQKAPCPPNFLPYTKADTYYWASNCSFDCGGNEYDGHICEAEPEPTPPPGGGGETPNCTLTLTGPDALVRGAKPKAFKAEVTVGYGVVERVVFMSLDPDLNPPASQTDGSSPYIANYAAVDNPADTNAIITATAYMGGLPICEASKTVGFVRPTTTVNVGVREVPANDCTPGANIGNVDVTMSSISPTGFNYSGNTSTSNPVSLVPAPVQAGEINYRINLSGGGLNNYVYQACSNGPKIRDFKIPYRPAAIYTQNFYFTRQAPAWYQVYGGDVGAGGGNVEFTLPSGLAFLEPGGVELSSGVAMASGTIDDGLLHTGNRDWAAEGVALPSNTSWFNYFKRTFDQAFTPIKEETPVLNDSDFDDLAQWTVHDEEATSYVMYFAKDLTVGDLLETIEVISGRKYTIFVPGNLTVNATNVTVPVGSYLGFVVGGKITFSGGTRNIEGVYITDGPITIQNAADSVLGINRQFNGEGIFVGNNVSLLRSLDDESTVDTNDDLANNLNPAERFTYRSDFLFNAPIGMKRIPVTWQEIAPTGVERVAPTESPAPTSTPICKGLPPTCTWDACCVNGQWQCCGGGGGEEM